MKILNIVLLLFIIAICTGLAYYHGINVGMVEMTQLIGPALEQCIKLIQ